MVYLDNAATSWPKPASVVSAVLEGFVKYGANPGRGGHKQGMECTRKIYECRSSVARFFGLSEQEAQRVIFTPGCTYSLNFVIKGIVKPREHIVVSSLEHNAVMRPVYELADRGVSYSVARVYADDDERTVQSFANSLTKNTSLVICTHASNVTGKILPVKKIGALCKSARIPFALDCAQSAGIIPININELNADFLCAPAHKALYGTMGLGVLICNGNKIPTPIISGGTGILSALKQQPAELPERLESGTPNVLGICALQAGINFINAIGISALQEREYAHALNIYERLSALPNIELISRPPAPGDTVPIVLFNIHGKPSEQTALMLSENNIAVRAGLHCSPAAHKQAGTFPSGAVRICPSAFTTEDDANYAVSCIKRLCV